MRHVPVRGRFRDDRIGFRMRRNRTGIRAYAIDGGRPRGPARGPPAPARRRRVRLLVVTYVAYPHRGEDLPAAPWLGEAMSRAADAAPTVRPEEDRDSAPVLGDAAPTR